MADQNDENAGRFHGAALGAGARLAELGTIVGLEQLKPEERETVDRYVRVSRDGKFLGVAVAVMRGRAAWDLRPLLLETARARQSGEQPELHLLRMGDPQAFLSADRKQFIENSIRAAERCRDVSPQKISGIEASGEAQGQPWIRRSFFARTLADVDQAADKTFNPILVAQRLIAATGALHRAGGVHGHLCAENLGIVGDQVVLLDFGFFAASTNREAAGLGLAPELQRGQLPTEASDVFALGKILRRLLAEHMSSEHREFLDLMSHPEMDRRPSLKLVEERFVPTQRVRSGSSKVIRNLAAGEVKSGKLISNPIAGETSSGIAYAAGPGPAPAANPIRSVAEVSALSPTAQAAPVKEISAEKKSEGQGAGQTLKKLVSKLKDCYSPRLAVIVLGTAALVVAGVLLAQLWVPETKRMARYQEQWLSTEVTERRAVVQAAVVSQDSAAQKVIVQDILSGAVRPGVRAGLLRTAFNSMWAEDLSATDRQQALLLALSSLLGDSPPALGSLKDAHPGVQLAAVGDLSLALSDGQFSDISVESLARLPAPFGPSFAELAKLGITNMEPRPARALAHIIVGNLGDNAVLNFVGQDNSETDFLARALVVGPFIELYPPLADELKRIMLQRDDRFSKRIEWFRSDPGKQWSGARSREQVLCAMGLLPQAGLSYEQLSDLLTFPAAKVRAQAAQILGKDFSERKIGNTLQFLASEQNRLTRPQVVLLMSALALRQREPQNEAVSSFLATWFATKPDPQSVFGLLVSRREIEGADPLSLESARYLAGKDWEASLEQLRGLVLHQEKLARALAYSRLDAGVPEELKLLEEGLKNENDARLREQVLGKIKSARVLSSLPTPGPVPPPELPDPAGLDEGDGADSADGPGAPLDSPL